MAKKIPDINIDRDPDGERLPVRIDTTSNGEFEPVPLEKRNIAANALAEATVAQPAIAALVAIGRGDQRAASLALGRCERAEQVRVVRIVSKAYAAQQQRAAGSFGRGS